MTRSWRVENLAVGFNPERILVRGITMTVSSGDFIAVTGPNGVGKTCLLRTFAGEIPPCLGSVVAPPGFGHPQLGIVPQSTDIELQVPMTLGEMISLGTVGQLRHPSVTEVEALSKEVGLSSEQLRQHWCRSSGGERQRCLVARALIRQPELVLMDEATSSLDPATATAVLKMLRRHCQDEGLVVIAVMHQDELVQTYADYRLHLDPSGPQLSAVSGS